MSAANSVMEWGGKVVVLDKSSFCGGNSTKATSGINGSNTRSQRNLGIQDSIEIFTNDTMKGGAKKPEIAKILCANSGNDVEWLMDKFNLDLSLVARLGGHSQPRTHRGKERFPGMTITYALIQMVEKVAETSDVARIVTKARVTRLLQNPSGDCVGCTYERGGVEFQEHGPVILATGGFGADFTVDSLLAKHRPDLMHLPTTNGEHCTGDGIKMGNAIGAKSIDLEWVQVHPTGLVKPDDPDAKIKFLAAEALRGVGGIVLNAEGKRFANELGRRDYVTGEMWKNKPPFRLCLNKAAQEEIIWHCKHYTSRGVMKFYANGKALADDMGVPLSVLEQTHEQHYHAAKKTESNPEGGPHPAYPSGKSWDEASGPTGSGKKFYHNIIPGSTVASEPFYVAIITPVIHYCMGGLEIDDNSNVVGARGAIKGLYAAGEVAGGVHGNNRLGGNSLLDCVVFGRLSGTNAAKYMLGADAKPTDLCALSGGGLTGEVKASKNAGGSYEDNMNKTGTGGDSVAKSGGEAKKGGAAKKSGGGGGGGYTLAEVAKHTTEDDCWVVLHGRVLNVTKFLKEHPGGVLAIMTFAGKDASEEFDMIHPPDVIEKYAPDAIIGMVGEGGGDDGEAAAAPAASGGASAPLLAKKVGGGRAWNDWDTPSRRARMAGEGKIGGWLGSIIYMVIGFMKEILCTIFTQSNLKFNGDRLGLTRSAIFLFIFMIIHAIGNLHVFLGPDDFNGYGYFYVRLYWTGFGLPANIVELYVLLAVCLHVSVALKRTWDVSINFKVSTGKMNLAFSGVSLLGFMIIHLYQFRFGATEPYLLRPPRYLVNFEGILTLSLFWTWDTTIEPVPVRDIYRLEFDLFKNMYWVWFYMGAISVFCTHMCLGWQKVVGAPSMDIPQRYQSKATHIGYVLTAFIACIYFSFPIYTHLCSMKTGALGVTG
jgi:flavocytochrome c